MSNRVLALIVVLFVWTLTTHGKFSNSGDEPHYLMITESLLTDHDLDLANNYEHRDGEWFSRPDLEAFPHARPTRSGAIWSVHDIGVSVAMLPVYAIATRAAVHVPDTLLKRMHQTHGLFAYSLMNIALACLTAFGAVMMANGLRRLTPDGAPAIVALLLALSPPVLGHAFLIFPEIFAFVAVCGAVWLLCLRDDELSPRGVIVMLAVLGLLPWFHRKFSFFDLGLLLLIVRRHGGWLKRTTFGTRAALAAVFLLPQIALHVWTFWAWGRFGGPQMLDSLPFRAEFFRSGGLGLLLDREYGLFGYGPIYLVVPACFALFWRRSWDLLVPIALLYLPMAAFSEWWGGFSPAARYLVPLTPLLAIPVARALELGRARWVILPIAGLQAAVSAYLWNRPRWLWPAGDGVNHALEAMPVVGPLYDRLLPSMAAPNGLRHAAIAAVIIAAASALLVFMIRPKILREEAT